MLKDFEMFEVIYNKPLALGLHVIVNTNHILSIDYSGEFYVTGLVWHSQTRKTLVTIEKNWAAGGSSGWSPLDLVPL